MAKYLGVDISVHNAGVDYKRLAKASYKGKKVKFAMLRLGFGTELDSGFMKHYEGCKAAGLYVGVYLYSYAKTPAEAQKEADFVLEQVKKLEIDYPIVFDYEDSSLIKLGLTKTQYTLICEAFLERVAEANYYPMLYTNPDWFTNRLHGEKLAERFELWLAHWTAEGNQRQLGQGMWQFAALGTQSEVDKGWATMVGNLDGAGGAIDVNYAYKGYAKLIRKQGKNKQQKSVRITATKVCAEDEAEKLVKELEKLGFDVITDSD